MKDELKIKILNLPLNERMELLDELLLNIAQEDASKLISKKTIKEIEARIERMKHGETSVLTLQDVREKISQAKMKYTLIFSEEADKDISETINWYNEQKPGLGYQFYLLLDHTFEHILDNPLKFQLLKENIRRALVDKFPYSIIYIVEENVIAVVAVIHYKRHPKTWEQRKK